MLTIGLFLIYTGFWGFYAAFNVPVISPEAIAVQVTGTTWTATNIYLARPSLSAITFNVLMSLSGGLLAAYVVSKGDAFWTLLGGLAGIIPASAGNDLYHPIKAMIIAAVGVVCCYELHFWVERRFKFDDAVGAVAVHGYAGFIGLVIAGFALRGAPSSPFEGYATVNPVGQIAGAVIMFFGLGFPPAVAVAKMQKAARVLRIPEEVKLEGIDYAEHHAYESAKAEIIRADKTYIASKSTTPAE